MPAELHIVERPFDCGIPDDHGGRVDDPGAMWRVPAWDTTTRECWVVVLPNRAGIWWTTYPAAGPGGLWEVTGEPPKLTVRPSINAGDRPEPGNWHGWITNGVMTP